MELITNIGQYKSLIKGAKSKYGKLQTNCFLFYEDVERIIRQERLFFKEVDKGVLFFSDETKYYQVLYYIPLDSDTFGIEKGDKPFLLRTIYVKGKKNKVQESLDRIIKNSGFSLLDTTTQVWTDVKENLRNMEKLYNRMESMLKAYGMRLVVAQPEHLDTMIELRDNTPELKVFHIPFQTRDEELKEIEKGHFACILNAEDQVCAARKIEIEKGNLYSPWFCVKEEYKDKYGLGLVMTGFEMKYAYEHNLPKVFGWIADDNTRSWNYHKRLGVNVTGRAADEWLLEF